MFFLIGFEFLFILLDYHLRQLWGLIGNALWGRAFHPSWGAADRHSNSLSTFLGRPKSKLSYVVAVLANNLTLVTFLQSGNKSIQRGKYRSDQLPIPQAPFGTDEVVSPRNQTLGIF